MKRQKPILKVINNTITAEEQEILDFFRRLNETQKTMIYAMLQIILAAGK